MTRQVGFGGGGEPPMSVEAAQAALNRAVISTTVMFAPFLALTAAWLVYSFAFAETPPETPMDIAVAIGPVVVVAALEAYVIISRLIPAQRRLKEAQEAAGRAP